MDATEVLEKALDQLRTDGWWQSGDLDSARPRTSCAGVAINNPQYPDLASMEAAHRLAAAIGYVKEPGARWVPVLTAIYEWNDDPRTTFEDVELAFKRAIRGEAA